MMWTNVYDEFSVLLWLLSFAFTTCDMFSTTARMESVVRIENMMVTEAWNYLNKEEARLEEIRSLIKQIEGERGSASKEPRRYLSHPLQSLQLLRRFRRQWQRLRQYVTSDKNNIAYEKNVKVLEGTPSYPSESDYSEATESVLRLQDTYKLDTSLLAEGDISKRQPKSPPLLAEDCYEIGITAWNNSSPAYARQWMKEALYRLRHNTVSYTHYVNEIEIMSHIASACQQEGLYVEALQYVNEILKIDPNNDNAIKRRLEYENMIKQPVDPHEGQHYKALCRGDEEYIQNIWPHNERSRLRCRLIHYNRPRLLIRPMKEEVVFENPRIVIYHDILTDMEADNLIRIAKPRLQRSQVVSKKRDQSKNRQSSVAWLDLHNLEGTDHILHRVEDYTGLSMSENHHEHLQIANYGIGGYYAYHYDDLSDDDVDGYDGMGKRIATLLFYLNDVDEGGATVFTKNGVRVAPSKKSAVFWYNYQKNGDRDLFSMHAGCPVLLGTKWAANLWILDFGQIFRRKCGLSQDDIYFS